MDPPQAFVSSTFMHTRVPPILTTILLDNVGLAIATRITHDSHQHELVVIIACTGGGIFVVLILVSIAFIHLRLFPTHQLLLSTTIITIIILVKAFFYH